jgi:ATP-binding cassette subfamily B protein
MLDEGSVKDIITYGLRDIADETIINAARLASASSFIEKLPDGYDTEIGRNGIELSLGQHQRLAIARALARDPKVLLLDEPTNHLDPEAVAQILHNLRELEHPPAILVVTHHADVMEWADHVVHVVPPEQS